MGSKLRPCGTMAAVRRHYKRKEPIDGACARAVQEQNAARNPMRESTHSQPFREVRNGIPEHVPYVYRGTGFDVLTPDL